MADVENSDEQVPGAEGAATAKKCAICHGKSGRPVKGNRCTADKCKRAYAELRAARGEPASSVNGASVPGRGCDASATSRAAKVQRLAQVHGFIEHRP